MALVKALVKKVCVIGPFAAGKTSLVRRYVLDQFSPDYQATLGVNISKYSDRVELADGRSAEISQILWDIEGSQGGESLTETYLRGAAGALVVGDVTRGDAVEAMQVHAERFLAILPGRPLVFAVNKIDLLPEGLDPETRDRMTTALTEAYGGEAIASSAASGEAVQRLFRTLARRIVEVGS